VCVLTEVIATVFTSLFRNHLTALTGLQSQHPLKRSIFSSDVAVQTEAAVLNLSTPPVTNGHWAETNDGEESELSAGDLASILKWSKDISSDINLLSGKIAFSVLFNAS
jgi:hypothetical protein